MAAAVIHVPDAMHNVTIKVTGLWGFKLRVWLASRLFILGAMVLGCQIEIERSDGWGEI